MKPTPLVLSILSRSRRFSIAVLRLSQALTAEYVAQGTPKISSITSVSRPSFETRENSRGQIRAVRPKLGDDRKIPTIPYKRTPSQNCDLHLYIVSFTSVRDC
jgi:hypothetical protein